MYQSVEDRRYSERTGFPVVLWNLHSSDWLGAIVVKLSSNQPDQCIVAQVREVFNRSSVRSCRSATMILFQISVCHDYVFFRGNEFHKIIELVTLLALGIKGILY